MSTTTIECFIKEACQGDNFEDLIHGTCHPNHFGHLCHECKYSFGRFSKNSLC